MLHSEGARSHAAQTPSPRAPEALLYGDVNKARTRNDTCMCACVRAAIERDLLYLPRVVDTARLGVASARYFAPIAIRFRVEICKRPLQWPFVHRITVSRAATIAAIRRESRQVPTANDLTRDSTNSISSESTALPGQFELRSRILLPALLLVNYKFGNYDKCGESATPLSLARVPVISQRRPTRRECLDFARERGTGEHTEVETRAGGRRRRHTTTGTCP